MSTESNIHVFYANQLYASYPAGSFLFLRDLSSEIYNGGYLLIPSDKVKWYRCDITPVLPEDVPPELKALCLIMGLTP